MSNSDLPQFEAQIAEAQRRLPELSVVERLGLTWPRTKLEHARKGIWIEDSRPSDR